MGASSENTHDNEESASGTSAETTMTASTMATSESQESTEQERRMLLNRAEAAKAFDVSVTTFRRRYEGHLLTPIVGPDGVHYFRQEAVHELVVQQRAAAAPEHYNGETAATVFRMFEEGAHPVDVVTCHKLHPRTVAAIHKEWVSLRGGYVVTGEIARQIAALPWLWGAFPIRDGERLLANLRSSSPRGLCADCANAVAEICSECAKRLSMKEAERRVAEARAHREELESRKRMHEWETDFKALQKRRRAT
jgi:hypothetical protein